MYQIVTKSHALSFKKLKLCTARAGNIIGGGDWAKDRIITDIVESINNKEDILIRSPKAIRPWQHVIDVVNGYLKLEFIMKIKKKCLIHLILVQGKKMKLMSKHSLKIY